MDYRLRLEFLEHLLHEIVFLEVALPELGTDSEALLNGLDPFLHRGNCDGAPAAPLLHPFSPQKGVTPGHFVSTGHKV